MNNLYQVGRYFGYGNSRNVIYQHDNPPVSLTFYFDKDTFYPLNAPPKMRTRVPLARFISSGVR